MPVDIGEPQLQAGMRAFPADDERFPTGRSPSSSRLVMLVIASLIAA